MAEESSCAGCSAPCRPTDRFCSQCGRRDPASRGTDQPDQKLRSETSVTALSATSLKLESQETPLPPGTVFAGRYRIMRMLGEGGMGRVYLAIDNTIDEPIALKFVSATLSSNRTILDQFKRELKLARRVRHRNVVASFHLGEAEGRVYITQEYIDSETLSALLERKGSLNEAETLGLLRQVLRGLKAAHDVGIVHRDIKTGNILVNKDGMAFITDFGLATSVDQGAGSHVAGTPRYMAPELFQRDAATPSSDIYACGIMLFHLFTGSFPFPGKSFDEIKHGHRTLQPEPIPQELPVSLPTREVYARMLEKNPLARPQRVVEVLEVFEDVLAVDALTIKTGRSVALVVDADPSVRSTAREVLEREGYHVEVVATAKEAVDLAFSHDTSLIVLDSNVQGGQDIVFAQDASMSFIGEILPRHGGLGFCRLLQHDAQLKRVPILVVTEQRHPGLKPAFLLMGAGEVIPKPFTPEEFASAIHRARHMALAKAEDG